MICTDDFPRALRAIQRLIVHSKAQAYDCGDTQLGELLNDIELLPEYLADERDPESGEAVLSAHADSPEPLSGNLLDVGEIVAEQLSLAADPYPRRPGAKLEDVLPRPRGGGRKGAPEQRRHPFAGLAALRDKPRRGR